MAAHALSVGVAYAGPACPRCGRVFVRGDVPNGQIRCYDCGTQIEATRFDPPAPLARVTRLAAAGPTGATACPQHPGNAAVGHCERCGILTCDLCQIEADRMRLCPGCFERLSDEGALASTRVSFRDHARLATTLAVLGLLFFCAGIVTGPAAIYYAVRARRQARAMDEPGGGWRLAIVAILGLAQFALSAWVVWAMVSAR
jgi:hypothetical protein